MSDIQEGFETLAERSKSKRANNRHSSTQILLDKGIPFTQHNNGAHLIVTPFPDRDPSIVIDFYPGTGRFKFRGAARYARGVFVLLAAIRKRERGL